MIPRITTNWQKLFSHPSARPVTPGASVSICSIRAQNNIGKIAQMHLNKISKPLLVDLLRVFHQRKYFIPHIRYASVRSKPELCEDLSRHFDTELDGHFIRFLQKNNVRVRMPAIRFDLQNKRFLFDEAPVEIPVLSRQPMQFSISHVPVTLRF